jgi:dTDP-4-dehydrorhamnose 3,5-epimerase
MRFSATPLTGLILVESDAAQDERGAFYRAFCSREFAASGLPGEFPQSNISRNRLRGTLRGMHFQAEPHPEGKLVRCIRGTAFDVAIDLRPGSPTYCKWFGTELSESNSTALYIPPGFAHGFQTLCDDTDMLYQMTTYYAPESAGGVRWDDPAFAIRWPLEIAVISPKDRAYSNFGAAS